MSKTMRPGRRERMLAKTLHKLARKREGVLRWMEERGHDVAPLAGKPDGDVLDAAYALCGMKMRRHKNSIRSLHSHYAAIMQHAGLHADGLPDVAKLTSLDLRHRPGEPRTREEAAAFYETYHWHRLRYEALKRDGGRCLLCGAGRRTGTVLHVDHIKPLRYYWHLRLSLDNVQVLCGDCNHGKGNWDETDWWDPPASKSVPRKILLRVVK